MFMKIIKKIRSQLCEHPKSVGETYFQHLRYALWAGSQMLVGGVCCTIHALFPFLFKTKGSEKVEVLYKEFQKKRQIHDVL